MLEKKQELKQKTSDENKLIKNKLKKNKLEDSTKVKKIKFHILAIISIIIFSAALCPVTLQNDTFYTIKIGEHIVNTGTVDMQDPFSWHENLPYTYPHWLYDVIIYLIYNMGGFVGIFISTVILACVLGIVVYVTNCKISKNRFISFLITLGVMFLLRNFIAARAQLVTFILLELTILLIEKFLETKRKRYALGMILISIAIANLHCAVWPFFFVLFLPYVAQYLIYTLIDANIIYKIRNVYYKKKLKNYMKQNEKKNKKIDYDKKINDIQAKINLLQISRDETIKNREKRRETPYKIKFEKNKAVKWLILIMIICAFTGLLTPIGDTPYTYLYKTMKGNTTQSISEHLPMTLIEDKEMLVVLVALAALMIFTDTKIRLKDLFMIAGLALLMLMTRRQESMFILFGSAILARMITDLFNKYDSRGLKGFEDLIITTLGKIIVILLVLLISVVQIKIKLDDKFVNSSSYPVKASEFIKENLDISSIKLYNEYNYGSYLLFEGIPVFIDSRADLYAPEFNGERQENGKYEGRDIFSDYISTSSIGKYYETTFEKYDITHIILYKNSKVNMLISKDDKYNQIYSDEKFVIYERN